MERPEPVQGGPRDDVLEEHGQRAEQATIWTRRTNARLDKGALSALGRPDRAGVNVLWTPTPGAEEHAGRLRLRPRPGLTRPSSRAPLSARPPVRSRLATASSSALLFRADRRSVSQRSPSCTARRAGRTRPSALRQARDQLCGRERPRVERFGRRLSTAYVRSPPTEVKLDLVAVRRQLGHLKVACRNDPQILAVSHHRSRDTAASPAARRRPRAATSVLVARVLDDQREPSWDVVNAYDSPVKLRAFDRCDRAGVARPQPAGQPERRARRSEAQRAAPAASPTSLGLRLGRSSAKGAGTSIPPHPRASSLAYREKLLVQRLTAPPKKGHDGSLRAFGQPSSRSARRPARSHSRRRPGCLRWGTRSEDTLLREAAPHALVASSVTHAIAGGRTDAQTGPPAASDIVSRPSTVVPSSASASSPSSCSLARRNILNSPLLAATSAPRRG